MNPARDDVVEIARAELGTDAHDAGRYWADVLGPTWQGPYPPHWCGAFALWCLRQAELTSWLWVVGKGFLYRLPRTSSPLPGDIGYLDQPFQHHFVVVAADDHNVTSIDGNQGHPGVQARTRPLSHCAFYSIEPLILSPELNV